MAKTLSVWRRGKKTIHVLLKPSSPPTDHELEMS